MKKDKKITINYYLRKLAHPKKIKFWGYNEEVDGQPIYIEVIHQRKNNSTISQFLKHVEQQNTTDPDFVRLPITESLVPEDFFNQFNSSFEIYLNYDFDLETNPFAKLILNEYHHIFAMVRYASDSIESNHFTLSRLSDAYNYSLIFVPDIIRNIMKDDIIAKFYLLRPEFPKLINKELQFDQLFFGLYDVIYENSEHLASVFQFEFMIYSQIDKELDNLFVGFDNKKTGTLSLPIWVTREFSQKIKNKMLDEKSKLPESVLKNMDIEKIHYLFQKLENEMLYMSEKMVSFFK